MPRRRNCGLHTLPHCRAAELKFGARSLAIRRMEQASKSFSQAQRLRKEVVSGLWVAQTEKMPLRKTIE